MTELIARIEAATGPDRELDAEIARSQGWSNAGDAWFDGIGERIDGLPAYTASIDAALTLVPEGWWREIKGPRHIPTPSPNYYSCHISSYDYEKTAHGWGATPALAIVAAALKAKEAGDTQ